MHCHYNECLLCFMVSFWTSVLPTIVLLCCDTTPHSSELFLIKSTQEAASLSSSHQRTPEGTCRKHQNGRHWWTLSVTLSPACVNSPKIGPNAQIEHPWTSAVTPWEKRLVAPAANWSVLSRVDSLKEILVTNIRKFGGAIIYTDSF